MATKGFIFDPVESPLLTSADVPSIREFLKQYQEYQTVWAERVAEGVITRARKPKSVLRCTDPDLWNRIKKYEMGKDVRVFNSETLLACLMGEVAAATQAVSLKDVLGNLTFDARLTDHKEKVGKVFQYVDKVILQNGIDGVFPVMEIASHIVKAVQAAATRGIRAVYHRGKGNYQRLSGVIQFPGVEVYSVV